MVLAALITGLSVIFLTAATWADILAGFRWWLRMSAGLIIRIPGLLLALFCCVVGVLFTYNVNLWMMSTIFFTREAGQLYFRFWALFFLPLAPVALLLTSAGFSIPLMSFFVWIPRLNLEPTLRTAARVAISILVALSNYGLLWLASRLFP
jgi:hypothetical protein